MDKQRQDARAPLYEHSLTLCGNGNEVTIWNDGEEKLNTDIAGLKAVGEEMIAQPGKLPEWFVPGSGAWPIEMVGTVLVTVAERCEADGGCDNAFKTLYGGKAFGPANPDMRHAGLVIEEDGQTLTWL